MYLFSEYAQEEIQNHLNRCNNEVLIRDSPTVIQQDQVSSLHYVNIHIYFL